MALLLPSKIAKESEHSHQVALFAYCAIAMNHGFNKADLWAEGNQFSSNWPSFPIPELKWLHAIHNQGHGDAIRGAKAKAEGVKPGVADLFLPVTKWKAFYDEDECKNSFRLCPGLYIEMKKPSEKPKMSGSKGGLSDEQLAFADFVIHQGYAWSVCYSWIEAVNEIKRYLN